MRFLWDDEPTAEQPRLQCVKAALADDLKPVHAGLEGGQYRPLTDADIIAINDTVFKNIR